MVGQEGPRVDGESAALRVVGQAAQEIVAVLVIPKQRASFDAPDHYVVEHAGSV